MSEEIKKSSIYTKKGDQGKTFLVSGSCVDKFNVRVEAYGTVDELNSILGMIRYHLNQFSSSPNSIVNMASMNSSTQKIVQQDVLLENIQNHLFRIGSLLACEDFKIQKKLPAITDIHIQLLEKSIDEFDANLPELKNFILPSGGLLANYFHLARTICRRSERRTAEIEATSPPSELTQKSLIYLNRLSDLFFVLARWNNCSEKIAETLWDKEK